MACANVSMLCGFAAEALMSKERFEMRHDHFVPTRAALAVSREISKLL